MSRGGPLMSHPVSTNRPVELEDAVPTTHERPLGISFGRLWWDSIGRLPANP